MAFKCSRGGDKRMTNNKNGSWDKEQNCYSGFDEMIARYQDDYGIINTQMSCNGNWQWSNDNLRGFNNNKQSCKPGKMVGIETREQHGYGIINFRLVCQNLS